MMADSRRANNRCLGQLPATVTTATVSFSIEGEMNSRDRLEEAKQVLGEGSPPVDRGTIIGPVRASTGG